MDIKLSQPIKPRRIVPLRSALLVLGVIVVIGFLHRGGAGAVSRPRGLNSQSGSRQRDRSKEEITKIMLKQYAEVTIPLWSRAHPGKVCPDKPFPKDAWGRPFKLVCPPPAGVKGIVGLISMGADGEEGTSDDLKSWE